MFLFAKITNICVNQNEIPEVTQIRSMFDIPDTNLLIIKFVVAHWNNAFVIHNWFVNNNLVGEFESHHLVRLLNTINQILQDNSMHYLLPPQELNEEYFQILNNTKTILERILQNSNIDLFEYSYVNSS